MEEIKPKKERKFLKVMGDIALTLFRELVLGIGKKVINKVGNKQQGLVIISIILASTFAIAQYPSTGNKQRLGYQTTGDGLLFRGRASDTTALKPFTINNAYHLFDTLNNVLFSYIKTKGGWKFNNSDTVIIQGVTMPFDSITFNTAKDGTVGVGEVEYNDTQGSLIQGLKGGNVTNVIGQQLHQRVNNRTGATLNKGDVVYLSGSQGNRITVAKALATTDPTSANTFGIVAESIANNQSGYIITEGLITGLNTSSLTQDSAVYLSGTTAGALTSTKPQAPIHGVYIGVCVKTNAGSGEVFVKIRNGQELDELHDIQISSPLNNASLYFKSNEGLWRDTTAALLVSDTASMLTNYLRTGVAASTYLTQSNAASTYLPLAGGTLNGTLNGTNQSLNSNLTISDIIPNNAPSIFTSVTTGPSTSATVKFGLNVNNSGSANMFLGGTQIGGGNGTNPNIFFTDTRRAYASIQGIYTGAGITSSGHIAFNTTPNDNTTALTERMRIASDGAITIGGTLGVTGATTLFNLASASTTIVTASTTGLLSGISTLPIANGGTGATTAATARTALGATVRGANTFILPDISAISFLRYNADNTVSQRAADGMRTDLGGTTIGQSMFTLTNPSAITFPRFNADNTVSALDATTFRTAIGAGTGNGNGTVTNVTGTLPISVANGTTTPSITIANASTTASGVVTTGTQSMAGNKTFTGDLATSQAFSATGFSTLTGGASIGTMATTSSLTHVLGVNSSNAIGEIGVADGIKFTSGSLGLDSYKTIALMDFPSTNAQSSSDITATVTGAVAGTPVLLGVPNAAVLANTSYSAWVSSTNTVTVRFNNYSSAAANPAQGSFYLIVLNL